MRCVCPFRWAHPKLLKSFYLKPWSFVNFIGNHFVSFFSLHSWWCLIDAVDCLFHFELLNLIILAVLFIIRVDFHMNFLLDWLYCVQKDAKCDNFYQAFPSNFPPMCIHTAPKHRWELIHCISICILYWLYVAQFGICRALFCRAHRTRKEMWNYHFVCNRPKYFEFWLESQAIDFIAKYETKKRMKLWLVSMW